MAQQSERDNERFDNLYLLQELLGKANYSLWYFNEHFKNSKADEISERINKMVNKIHDMINDICMYDERY